MKVIRIPWIPNLFYKFVKTPFLEFAYLLPGLFFLTPILLILRDINVIAAHGLVAGFVGVFWGKIFGNKVTVSTQNIYHFPEKGIYRNFVKWIFINANFCLVLSKQAAKEIESLDIPSSKVKVFTYWIDMQKFTRIPNARKKLGWKGTFFVLFVGRLIEEKGIIELLEATKKWDKNIVLTVVGIGPLSSLVQKAAKESKNIKFVGNLTQDELPIYYSGSDILIVPSVHEEGFGRVILEALACGTPIIGSRRGAIPEAMDESVGKLIDVNPESIKQAVEFFYLHREKLRILSNNCRAFAERRYSEKNVEKIIKYYTK